MLQNIAWSYFGVAVGGCSAQFIGLHLHRHKLRPYLRRVVEECGFDITKAIQSSSGGFKARIDVSNFLWILYRESVKSCGCQNHSCRMNSGKRSSRCCRRGRGAGDGGQIIAGCWRAFCGGSRPARVGGICRPNIPAPAPAGDGCSCGKRKRSGWRCGASSWLNWTGAANWTGAKVLWMGVLLPLKRGRLRRPNQAGQGHEVDGGGRRPRCSSGEASGIGLAGGSEVVAAHTGDGAGTARRTRTTPESVAPGHCRQGLRQRSGAPGIEAARQRVDLSASEEPAASAAPRRTQTAALSQTLEGGAHLCVARKLPPVGGAL